MAKLLVAGDSTVPNALSAYLRETLPDDFVVVSDPVVQGCALDAIAVGPGGLTLIAGEGSRTAAPQPDHGRRAGATPPPEQAAVAAVRAFLKDTFPALDPPVHYLIALRDTTADPPAWRVVDFIGAGPENLAEAVVRIQAADADAAASALGAPQARDDLAVALYAQRLTVSQRATRPFVFRGGGPLGARAKAWTVRDAVKHMDRYPADGVYHLNNGTLAQWLDEEGAADLAELARDAVEAGRADRRKALEIFLTGTGLVPRPRLVTRPKVLDLGYAISGETVAGRIRLGRGRGRGYLFGNLEPGAPWLEVQPRSFAGSPIDLAVTADTHALLIGPDRYEAAVLAYANAAAEPISLPVRLRMVGSPAPVNRFLHRPIAGLLLGCLLGALVGWLWAQVAPRVAPAPAWTLAVAALWGIIGLVRGALQPPAWPVLYATRRWLIRLAIWGAILALAGTGLAAWWQRGFGQPGDAPGQLRLQAALIGVILANIPASVAALRRPGATVSSTSAGQAAAAVADLEPLPRGVPSWPREHARGIAWGTLAAVVLILALIFTPRLAHTEWASVTSQGGVVATQGWVEAQWGKLNAAVDDLVNRLTLRYYDRRAPLAPTPAVTVTPAPTQVGGTK